ncbi:MAG: hypothetical protein WAV11_02180 [Minisyncoccia bacterium]
MAKLSVSSNKEYICNNVLIIIKEGNEQIIDESMKDFMEKFFDDKAVNIYTKRAFIFREKFQLSFKDLSKAYYELGEEINFIIADDEIPVMIMEQVQRHLIRIGFRKKILVNSLSGTNTWSYLALE